MTQQEINQAIGWLQALDSKDTTFLNSKLDSLIVWVDPISSPPQNPPPFSLYDLADLLNLAETLSEVQQISQGVYDLTNALVQTGVRADKGARPIKS